MLFSVITVSFNSAKTISTTLESMLAQSCSDYEYIIVDGASKDDTVEIIKSYESKFKGKMRWLSEPDTGICDAMNKGIRMSQGDLIGILNSDDNYVPDALKSIKDAVSKTPNADVYYGIVRNCFSDGREKELIRNHHNELALGQTLHHPGCFISRKTHERVGYYDTTYHICGDFDMFYRIYKAKSCFCPVNKIITNYIEGGVSMSFNMHREGNAIRYKYGLISYRKYLRSKIITNILAFLKCLESLFIVL